MKALPIGNNILFAFLNEAGLGDDGSFKEVTKSGLIVTRMLATQAAGRWAKALLVGPETKDVKAGQYVFIQPLMWTLGFKFDGVKIWKTDEAKILAVSDELPEFQVS